MINLYFDPYLNESKNINVDYHLCLSHSIVNFEKESNSFTYHPNLDVLNSELENYVLFFGSLVYVDIDLIFELKYVKKCKILYWSTEDPFESIYLKKFINHIDFYFTNDIGYFHQITSKVNSIFLPMAACKECAFVELNSPTIDRTLFVGNSYGTRSNLLLSLPRNVLDQIDFIGSGWPEHFNIVDKYISPNQVAEIMAKYTKVLDLQRSFSLSDKINTFVGSTIGPRVFMASAVGSQTFSYGSIQDNGILIPPGLVKFSDNLYDLVNFIDSQNIALREVDRKVLIKHTYKFNTFESRINKIINVIRKIEKCDSL